MQQADSEFSRYLKQASGEGKHDSHGSFSLSKEQVLKKLASFSFPYAGAWLVKTVQALVAAAVDGFIEVKLLPEKVIVRAKSKPIPNFDQLEETFLSPDLALPKSAEYLRTVLWYLALSQRREIWISLPTETSLLYWTGDEFRRITTEEPSQSQSFELTVSHLRYDEARPLMRGSAKTARQNAELLDSASTKLYAVPVPLTVDGRRMDTLCRPCFGSHNKLGFPVAFRAIQDQELPALTIPPGTFLGVQTREQIPLPQARETAQHLAGLSESRPQVSLAWLLTVNAVRRSNSAFPDVFEAEPRPSKICWLLHGAEVMSQELKLPSFFCSAVFFASAEGLGLDVGGFGIREDETLQERRAKLAQCLAEVSLVEDSAAVFEAQTDSPDALNKIYEVGKHLGTVLSSKLPTSSVAQSLGAYLSHGFDQADSYQKLMLAAQTHAAELEQAAQGLGSTLFAPNP